MGFPESVLTSDERVVLHLHPHWKALIRPILVIILAIAATAATMRQSAVRKSLLKVRRREWNGMAAGTTETAAPK